jgi:hypothetical protein
MLQQSPIPESKLRPVASHAEAEQVIGHLSDVMDALLELVEEETRLVRAGRLSEVAKLEPAKTDLARQYVADTTRLKVSQPYLTRTAPETLDELRARHDRFRALLQINLTVLATAHAVSEGIMRGVNSEMQRRNQPQRYTAAGRTAAPDLRRSMPLSVSRSL